MQRSIKNGLVSTRYITSNKLADNGHSTDPSDVVHREAVGPGALIMCKDVRCEPPTYFEVSTGIRMCPGPGHPYSMALFDIDQTWHLHQLIGQVEEPRREKLC